MNAIPVNLNPGNAVQAPPQAGKQADSTAPEVPFSQVLSNEIAQSRKSDETRQDTETGTEAGQDTENQTGGTAEAGAASTARATESGESARDPQGAAQAKDAAPVPEALQGLVIPTGQLKPEAAGTDRVAAEGAPASTLAATTLPFQSAPKGRAPLAAQAGPFADSGRGRQKIDPALSGESAIQPTSTAAAFTSQLATARQAEVQKTGEFLSDLMSNPAMRPATHAPLDTLSTPGEIAPPRLTPILGTTAWGQALGEKIVWMASNTQQSATLTLNPPHLGPLQVVLNVSNEQATASFFSAQPEVRQALEAAFPRLREMMNEAGIQLGQATVSADTPQQNDASGRQAQRAATPFPGADEAVAAGPQTVHAPVQRSGRGLIDTFA
ncbi:MAG: flagellar hook-length control protein FliK [Candidatus Thermoplasmatota archaeon]|nr:flagellar hook-length control protein FliK [Candidatus Thermoplasmatota archaeon]